MQFHATNGQDLLAAAKRVAKYVDAVDLNLGCPQTCAAVGGYGAYLMYQLSTVRKIFRDAVAESPVPLTAKIRIFEDEARTVAYAKMLEECGVQMLAVHGRTLEDYCSLEPADLAMIRAVKEAVQIPVLANGNVLWYDDVERCMEATGCDGVMVANALLWDPRLFSNPKLPLLSGYLFDMEAPADAIGLAVADEYLSCVQEYGTWYICVFHHLKKLMYHFAVHQPPEMILELLEMQADADLQAVDVPPEARLFTKRMRRAGKDFIRRWTKGATADVEASVDALGALQWRNDLLLQGLVEDPHQRFGQKCELRWTEPKLPFKQNKHVARDMGSVAYQLRQLQETIRQDRAQYLQYVRSTFPHATICGPPEGPRGLDAAASPQVCKPDASGDRPCGVRMGGVFVRLCEIFWRFVLFLFDNLRFALVCSPAAPTSRADAQCNGPPCPQ